MLEELCSVISSSSWLRYPLISYRSSRSDSIRLLLSAFAEGLPTLGRADKLSVTNRCLYSLTLCVGSQTRPPLLPPAACHVWSTHDVPLHLRSPEPDSPL